MGEYLKKLREQLTDKEAEEPAGTIKTEITGLVKEARIVIKHVIRDYKKHSLLDLVSNSIDIAMEIMKQRGVTEDVKRHWEYYVELYNCCQHEEYANVIAPDVRSRILDLHSHQSVYERLKATSAEDYENATLHAAKAKKEDILKFWDEYIENRSLEAK